MLKELVLSLILSAYSAAPFLDSPKRAIDWNEYGNEYGATITYVGSGGASEFNGMFYSEERQIPLSFTSGGDFDTDWFTIGQGQDRDRVHFYGYWNMLDGQYHFQFLLSFYLETNNWQEDVEKIDELETYAEDTGNYPINNLSFTPSTLDEGPYEEDGEYYYSRYFDLFFSPTGLEQGAEFSAGWRGPEPPQEVIPNFTFKNCHLEGLGQVFVGDNLEITLIANDGFGIPNTTQIITNGQGYNAVTMVSESEPLQAYPGLFNKVVFRFNNVAANLAATFNAADLLTWAIGYQWGYDDGATDPTDTAYQNGYSQGSKDGYRTGYQDGKKDYQAGGIWSWFESAANVLSSFLDIRLFPSFTIGNLVGAIVGLTIILFFVRAFLFKS